MEARQDTASWPVLVVIISLVRWPPAAAGGHWTDKTLTKEISSPRRGSAAYFVASELSFPAMQIYRKQAD